MGKRKIAKDETVSQEEPLEKKPRKEKKEKKERKDRKEKKEKREKKEKNIKNDDATNDSTKLKEVETINIPIHDLITIEHSISVIQDNIKKILDVAPDAKTLSKFINQLADSSIKQKTEINGDVTTKLLLLSKSHKIQLASQLKTLHQEGKLKIFDQIIDFDENSKIENADDVQLLVKTKKKEAYAAQEEDDDLDNSGLKPILPKLPIIYDSVLEAKVFVHKSATNGDLHSSKLDQVQSNNERLEYLGDAVLETIISDIIELRYKEFDEGQLSLLRSTLVKNETIEIISRAYKFPERQDELLRSHVIRTDFDNNSKIRSNKRVADLFEAYIGALFIEKGRNGEAYDFIKKWLAKVYSPILEEFESSDIHKYSHVSKQLMLKMMNNSRVSADLKKVQAQVITPPSMQSTSVGNFSEDFPITIPASEPLDKKSKADLYALIGCAKLHPEYRTIKKKTTVGTTCIVECYIQDDVLGRGEGTNIKEASARAASAALLNKPLIEKYHLIRMMTPREETRTSTKFESEEKAPAKLDTPSKNVLLHVPQIIKRPKFISADELSTPNSSSRGDLTEQLGKYNVIPKFEQILDDTNKSLLPKFKTTLSVNGIVVAECIEASKKKGANKVSQYLLDLIKEHGENKIFHDLKIVV